MKSKLSWHVSTFPDNNIYDWVVTAQPTIIKIFNYPSDSNIDLLMQKAPNALFIYRHFWDVDPDYHGPADMAFNDAKFKDTFDKLRGRGLIWEGVNEPIIGSVSDALALNAWFIRWAELLHGAGEKVAAFSFSTGNPDLSLVSNLVGAAGVSDYIAMHEYYGPTTQYTQIGRATQFMAALGIQKPVLITECGFDDGQSGGWQTIYKSNPQSYLDILKNIDNIYAGDNDILGFTVFQDGDGNWRSFDTHPIGALLADQIATYQPTPVTPPVPPIPPIPPTPSVSFTASPVTIDAGGSSTLSWNVTGVQAIFLDGVGVTGPTGSKVVFPAVTAVYVLHVVFVDNTSQDYPVTVVVNPVIPPPPPPPVPALTAFPSDPRLAAFPRPVDDNGRGMHFRLNINDKQGKVDQGIQWAQAINIKWSTVAGQDWAQILTVAKKLWAIGVMPVCRLICKIDRPVDFVTGVKMLKAAGIPPYVQVYNEPGDDREWKGRGNISKFGGSWAHNAALVFDAGGMPGLQVLGIDEFQAAIGSLLGNGRKDVLQKTWFCLHNGGSNHPPSYPYDDVNQNGTPVSQAEFNTHDWAMTISEVNALRYSTSFVGTPHNPPHHGETIMDDDTAVLRFIEFKKWMIDAFGFCLPMIGGEAGWAPGTLEDRRYPKVNVAMHAAWHKEMYQWFETGVVSNGDPLPDELFNVDVWIQADWSGDGWFAGVLGPQPVTIAATQSIPPFVRQFGYSNNPTPPTPPGQPVVSLTITPSQINLGQEATVSWDIENIKAATLDGQPITGPAGKLAVSPKVTTTYVLHAILMDGTTKDVSQTLVVVQPPPQGVIDPRAVALGVKITPTPNAKWQVDSVGFQDPVQSGGNHIILFTVLDLLGSPKANINCFVDWVGRDPTDKPTKVVTNKKGQANVPIYANLDIHKLNGPYFAYVEGQGVSDVVRGMGLPEHHHVNFLLEFHQE